MTSGYNEIIDKGAHSIDEPSSCIDLVFSSNVNLRKTCKVEQTLNKKSHHNIIYGTLNFNKPLPHLYFTEMWDFKNANIEFI